MVACARKVKQDTREMPDGVRLRSPCLMNRMRIVRYARVDSPASGREILLSAEQISHKLEMNLQVVTFSKEYARPKKDDYSGKFDSCGR